MAGLGRLIFRRRWTIYVLLWLVMFGAAAWGLGVLSAFKTGGFEDPHASSTFVTKITTTYFPGVSSHPAAVAALRAPYRLAPLVVAAACQEPAE